MYVLLTGLILIIDMILDERLYRDITELQGKSEISSAVQLTRIIKPQDAESESHKFSTRGVPHYYYGKRDKDTVVVNLNPGKAAKISDKEFEGASEEFKKQPIDLFIENYHKEQSTYELKTENADSFDVKQAAFLTPWEDSGIDLCQSPDWNDKKTRNEAAKKVIDNKLQLELVPYASAKFDFSSRKVNLLFPYVEMILDEIFAQERKYVIFASGKFEYIFKRYNNIAKTETFTFGKLFNPDSSLKEIHDGSDGKLRVKCRAIWIHYKGKTQPALIAHTFPSQGLGKAYDLMQTYGRLCYEQWCQNVK